ncbi:uncharacterized protein LOC118806701 [Colossoma macropomum]|uniref:uncharacterized protein LOC118806701 n=1 Tax=Colossoma macropomum TaxID=42526 RepID=UPI001864FA4F|nr:uncharacterized protein LOC118806701 [Colossoma macropomum]
MFSALLFCWAALKLHAPGTCYPLQQAPSPSDVMEGDSEEHRQAETKSPTDYLMEKNDNEGVQKTIYPGSKEIFTYLENQPKGCFSVLNVKSKMFLCLDSKRKLYTSVDDSDENCRFHYVKRHKHYDVFRSCRGNVLVILRQMKAKMHTHNSSELSSGLLIKQHKKHTNRRKRRSWHIDPSDPLGCEYPVVRAINNQRRQPLHGGNVSKETIAFVEDPFHVVSPGPLSPSQERMKNRRGRL